MQIYEKIRAVREAEGLTQQQFADLTGIPLSTIKKIDSGVNRKLQVETLLKVTSVDDFKKYSMWLVSDDVNPTAGQISPEIKLSADQLKTGS